MAWPGPAGINTDNGRHIYENLETTKPSTGNNETEHWKLAGEKYAKLGTKVCKFQSQEIFESSLFIP